MAEDKKNTNTPLPEATKSQTTSENDGSEYYLKKNRYLRIKCSQVKDEIEGVGVINFKQPIPQFDTLLGKAYAVNRKIGDSNDIYAIVLDKKYPIRLSEINKLGNRVIQNMVNIIAAQVVPTSAMKGRAFAVVLEKPKGITLAEYIKKNGPINSDYIARILVPTIGDVIINLSSVGVTHGRINTNNVYINDSGIITLGECISEVCGFSQPLFYETLDRASAMPIGKGSGTSVVDFHAMGVLAAISLRGKDPTENMDPSEILDNKFEQGTYKIATNGIEISPRLLDLFRGVLTERKTDIWNVDKLKEWIKGRRYNLLPPTSGAETGRPIIFNGKKYTSRKSLVHGLYTHWDEAKKFIKQDAIIKWVDRDVQEDDLVDRLQIASSHYGRDRESLGFDKEDEMLAHYILLLDPNGPIRLREFSANIDGIGAALADGIATSRRTIIDSVEIIIMRNLQSVLDTTKIEQLSLQEAMFIIQKCSELLRKKDLGFGIERCLYELNPVLPCQSPLLIEELNFTKEEILQTLNNNENIGGKIIDRHMAAFLSERMDLPVKIHISSLVRFPDFALNAYIQNLALLSLAQQTGTAGELPKLSAKIYEGLKNLIQDFHSKTIRNELDENLKKVMKKGILAYLLRVIADPKLLVRDRIGFKKALNSYKANAIQIVKLSNARAVNNIGYRYGLQIAVMISFFIATVELITLMIKAF